MVIPSFVLSLPKEYYLDQISTVLEKLQTAILYFLYHYTVRYVLRHKLQDHKEPNPNLIKVRFLNYFKEKLNITQSLWNNDCTTLILDASSVKDFDFFSHHGEAEYIYICSKYNWISLSRKILKLYVWGQKVSVQTHIYTNVCWSAKT